MQDFKSVSDHFDDIMDHVSQPVQVYRLSVKIKIELRWMAVSLIF